MSKTTEKDREDDALMLAIGLADDPAADGPIR